MVDKRNPDDDEEYQFPSHEYLGENKLEEEKETEGEFEPIPEKRNRRHEEILERVRSEIIKNKRMVAIIGIVLVIFIAVNLFRPHHTTQVISTNPVRPQVSSVTSQAANNLQRGGLEGLPQQPNFENQEASNLQQSTAANQQQLDKLQSQITSLQDTIQKLQDSQNSLATIIGSMNEQLKIISVGATAPTSKKTPIRKVLTAILPVYHLRAIIPGRAWLEDDQGQSISVAIGDRVMGYGIITQIDAGQGLIITDSGRRIGFQ